MAPAPQPERALLTRIFLSPNENRLRAGWRLLIHFILFVVCTFTFGAIVSIPLLLTDNLDMVDNQLINQGVFLLSITVSAFLARRFIDRRSIASLGLAWDWQAGRDVLAGIAITFVMMGAIYLAEWGAGWLEFEAFAWQVSSGTSVLTNTLIMLLVFVLVGWNEELLSRGYWLQNLADGLTLPWGVAISSTFFALMHLGNPNVTWVAILGLVLAGIFMAYGYVRTRQLWLPIGIHIGWNFFESTVFGFPVSGLDASGLLAHTVNGPELITGGAFGPEAGLVVVPAMALGAGLIYLYSTGREVAW